jgi:RHS repeat-associated protein
MSTPLVELRHTYDRDSNRLTRKNVVAGDAGAHLDQSYGYDGLNRLVQMQRGQLTSGVMTPNFGQQWGLDQAGNWSAFRQDDTGGGTWNLQQQRLTNKGNEIVDITASAGSVWATPSYDPAGNMRVMPKPQAPTKTADCVYDAWNRLVKVKEAGETVVEYGYDGRSYRTEKALYADGSQTEARHFYYSSRWQVLEERLSTPTPYDLVAQYVWGIGINELIVRDRSTGGSPTLNERLYGLQDSHFDVVCAVNTGGTAVERYEYEAYGKPSYYDGDYAPIASSAYDWTVLYSGYLRDEETSLYYVRYRYYHDTLGLWITRDPLFDNWGEKMPQFDFLANLGEIAKSELMERTYEDDPSSISSSIYMFIEGNPFKYVDVSGTNPAACGILGGEIGTAVCPGPGTLIGGLIGIIVGIVIIVEVEEACRPKRCLPCSPMLGSIAYRIDYKGPSHAGIPTPHSHRFMMNQSPPAAGCICFWVETQKHPLPGVWMPEITPASGGGVAL